MTSSDEHHIVQAVTRLETKMEVVEERFRDVRSHFEMLEKQQSDFQSKQEKWQDKIQAQLWRILWILLVSLLGVVLKSNGLSFVLDLLK